MRAHEIPLSVTAQIWVAPEAQTLRLAVRVPLASMRDTEFPGLGRTGYLDLERLRPMLPDLANLWVGGFVRIEEDGVPITAKPRLTATQISPLGDRSFATWPAVQAHLAAPPPANDAGLVASQVWFDMAFDLPIRSAASRFAIRPGLDHLGERVSTTLYFKQRDNVRTFHFDADPGLTPLDPTASQAFFYFLRLGFTHILEGTDHLRFLLCLIAPLRRLRTLALVVTAFTAAHSLTLSAAAFGWAPGALWFPALVETVIAASILYMALENILGAAPLARRWTLTMLFGLVHGFGFSFALAETLQLAGNHQLSALAAFNLGVELGQLAALALMLPALHLLFTRLIDARRGLIVLSALVAHTAWHWMAERGDTLRRYTFTLPELDAAFGATALRWLMALLVVAAAARLIHRYSYTLEKP
ncbi:MAG: HupE/UreJ family protein [Bryobacterales bacterium]|nr:HupE/UreJ family protein [Bryobacterales bacterium]